MSLVLAIAQHLYDSGTGTAIRESDWVFSILETVHVLSATLVFGTIAIVDLRILGLLLMGESVRRFAPGALRVTWSGFVVMVATGTLLFWSEATRLVVNPAFQVKVALLLLAGLNLLLFHATAYRRVAHWGDSDVPAPAAARTSAAISLLVWTGVLIAGRAIAYL